MAADPSSNAAAAERAAPRPTKFFVYVGTYSGPKSKGIYLYRFDAATGELTAEGVAGETKNPSFVTIHPNHKFLYSVNEIDSFNGKKGGAVTAFSIDPATGKLTQLNQQPSGGGAPCHLVVDPSGRNVLAANYSGGSVTAIPVGEDGKLGEPTAFIQHAGEVADKKRQGGPHAHSINVDASGKFACAADLGLDRIFVYKLDASKGTLTPNDPPAAVIAPKSGPRHFAFHPNGKFAYVINEIAMTVVTFAWDAEKGVLTTLQTVPTIPGEVKPEDSTAEVQVHPSGRFLYGSNRGPDSIAIFTIDQDTGKLTPAGHQPTGGKTPRNFGIDPTGNWLLAANQSSNSITVFRIDQKTGALTPTGTPIEIQAPVCVKFLAVK